MENLINNDLNFSSSDEIYNENDDESDHESNNKSDN